MDKNMKQVYEDLIQLGLLRIKDGKLSLKRPKPGLKEMVKNDPRFDSFRNNATEFKYVAQSGKLLREPLKPINFPIPHSHRRLHSLLQKIVNTDLTNKKGSRSIMNGDISLFKEFSFNEHSCLSPLLRSTFISVIYPKKGKAVLIIPFLDTERDFSWPENAQAVEIDSMLVSINFDTEAVEESRATSVKILKSQKTIPPFKLITEVDEYEGRILLHVVALRFYFKAGQHYHQSNNRNFNPVEIYNVERGK